MAKNKKKLIVILLLSGFLLVLLGYFIISSNNKKVYKISFDSMGGNNISSLSIKEGELVTRPTDPLREDYVFIGWEYKGQLYDFSKPISGNLVLVAKWQKKVNDKKAFIVKFDTDGGSTVINQVIEEDKKIIKPVDPKKKDYKFLYWLLDGEEYNFSNIVTKDITLKAVWGKEKTNSKTNTDDSKTSIPSTISYKVVFNSDGGSSVSSQTIKEGDRVTKPSNPSKNGYTFEKWTLNGDDYDFSLKVESNITLVAKWIKKQVKNYTVAFNSNGGSSVSSQSITEGNKATKPSNPTREGYSFVSWTLNENQYNFDNPIVGDIILTATWNQRKYTIDLTRVDNFSLDYVVHVYDDTLNKINVTKVLFNDGTLLCDGSNMTINLDDIGNESTFIIVLTSGTRVTATLA